MNVVTLVIAVIGALTGIASLVWSIATHVLSGGRVEVKLLGGWTGPGALITAPLKRGTPIRPDPNFVNEPILAVRVSNTGRLPVAVEHWDVKVGKIGLTWLQHPANEPTPKLLGVGESATWVLPVSEVVAAAMAAEEAKVNVGRAGLRASVTLGAGKERASSAVIAAQDLPSIFPP